VAVTADRTDLDTPARPRCRKSSHDWYGNGSPTGPLVLDGSIRRPLESQSALG
jgi:hypothetical protein